MVTEVDANRVVRTALELSRALHTTADKVESECRDDGCAVVCGVMRDCAYKLKGSAERELNAHRRRGLWKDGAA